MAGREQEADEHFSELINLMDKIDARRHLEVIQWQSLWGAACKGVASVGHSSERIKIQNSDTGDETEIDLPDADAIRSKGKLEVGEMQEYEITVDGLIIHNKQIKIPHLTQPGKFMTVHVRDPVFDQYPNNVYTDALINRSRLLVKAKPTITKDGQVKTLYIMNAEPIIDDNT